MGSQWSGRAAGSALSGRTREAERIAAQAWDELVSALDSGGATARSLARRGADLADEAGGRLTPAVRESRRRAGAAAAALSGRRAPIQWELILAAGIGGAVVGWVAGTLVRRAAEEQFILDETAAQDTATVA
jgi:hypothetical protein